jgi:hypothetical protein
MALVLQEYRIDISRMWDIPRLLCGALAPASSRGELVARDCQCSGAGYGRTTPLPSCALSCTLLLSLASPLSPLGGDAVAFDCRCVC